MAKTEISTLGEFGLIKQLTNDIKPLQPSTKKGVGDDCAVMDFNGEGTKGRKDESPETRVLMTTDMLLEGIHFNEIPRLQSSRGQFLRYIRDERHTNADNRFAGHQQTFLGGRYSDALFRYPPRVRALQRGHRRR